MFQCFNFIACDDVADFTTDRSAILQFSRSQVEFDTLITTIPSSTQTLIVYNRGDKGLRISEVALAGGSGSPFRVNVTGQDLIDAGLEPGVNFKEILTYAHKLRLAGVPKELALKQVLSYARKLG